MSILKKIGTILRANLNDLIDRAADPEKMANQLVLDMEEALKRLKTQVASAIADRNLLEEKARQKVEEAIDWRNKAKLAVDKGEDDLAREALRRARAGEDEAEKYQKEVETQAKEVDKLKSTLGELTVKLEEARGKRDMIVAQVRRARIAKEVSGIRSSAVDTAAFDAFDDLERKVAREKAEVQALEELRNTGMDNRLRQLGADDEIEAELKALKEANKKEG
ncbi:MAG: PspA/IM30 family protein [Firmicutes bacterium]|nr:PspA/IM30 family protein [Bacillota bacterium]